MLGSPRATRGCFGVHRRGNRSLGSAHDDGRILCKNRARP